MSFQFSSRRTLDYAPVRYGGSRISFRGPQKDLSGPYVAFLGGSETFGKYVEAPFPDLVEKKLGMTCVNLGFLNAGIDAFLHEAEVLGLAGGAEVTVIQVMGAQNMSNRFYRVHPRRNDRFLEASNQMQSVFREVDFTEYNFTRHMLLDIAATAGDRFSFISAELRSAWTQRMLQLLDALPGRKVLLWFANHVPPQDASGPPAEDPWFVDKGMIDSLRDHVSGVVEICPSRLAQDAGAKGKVFAPKEWSAAQHHFGPLAHVEASDALVAALAPLINQKQSPKKNRPPV